jgi:hypothetical protein
MWAHPLLLFLIVFCAMAQGPPWFLASPLHVATIESIYSPTMARTMLEPIIDGLDSKQLGDAREWEGEKMVLASWGGWL